MWVRVSFDRQKGKWIVLLLLLLATEKMPTMLIIFDHIFLLLLLLVALFCGAYGRFRFVPARNSASQEHVQLVWETLSWKGKRNEFFIDTRFDGGGGGGRHFDGLRLAGRSGTAVARSLLQQQPETGRPSNRSHPTLENDTHTQNTSTRLKNCKESLFPRKMIVRRHIWRFLIFCEWICILNSVLVVDFTCHCYVTICVCRTVCVHMYRFDRWHIVEYFHVDIVVWERKESIWKIRRNGYRSIYHYLLLLNSFSINLQIKLLTIF